MKRGCTKKCNPSCNKETFLLRFLLCVKYYILIKYLELICFEFNALNYLILTHNFSNSA